MTFGARPKPGGEQQRLRRFLREWEHRTHLPKKEPMTIEFKDDYDRTFFGNDADVAFERFIEEILSSVYSDLQRVSTGGRDGGIDLIAEEDHGRTVVECKLLSVDGFLAAKRSFDAVAQRLQRHLASSTPGQSQYQPWFERERPVVRYVFAISSKLENLARVDALAKHIKSVFDALAHSQHLRHLKGLDVAIVHRAAWLTRLRERPRLEFRWFPRLRPTGLAPLLTRASGTYRSYLHRSVLPYYSLRAHKSIAPPPIDTEIIDEFRILENLSESADVGTLITGGGGFGKTRLTLEIGHLAEAHGWQVTRVTHRLESKGLEDFARRLNDRQRVLLLFDYVETSPNHAEVVAAIQDLVAEYSLHLRYLANCRTSFYPHIAGVLPHAHVDLSPPGPRGEWFRGYRVAVVRHILESSGIESDKAPLAIQHSPPIFSVFVAHLQRQDRPEPSSFSGATGFSSWLHKRVSMSFGREVDRITLASLLAALPLPSESTKLFKAEEKELFRILAQDYWVERELAEASSALEEDSWVAAHDVQVDSLLVRLFSDFQTTCSDVLDDLADSAVRLKSVASLVTALERIINEPPLRDFPWLGWIKGQLDHHADAWSAVRTRLFYSQLLDARTALELLRQYPSMWDGALAEWRFRFGLVRVVRSARESIDPEDPLRGVAVDWITRAAASEHATKSVVAEALAIAPKKMKNHALHILESSDAWRTREYFASFLAAGVPKEIFSDAIGELSDKLATEFPYCFLARDWLSADGPLEVIASGIRRWFDEFATARDASFLFRSFLDAGGDPQEIEGPLAKWLTKHAGKDYSDFILTAWLDAGGSHKLVREPVLRFLQKRAEEKEADFLFRKWMQSGEPLEEIAGELKRWLAIHGQRPRATYLYSTWLHMGGDPKEIESELTQWLESHSLDLHTCFIYSAWAEQRLSPEALAKPAKEWLKKWKNHEWSGFVCGLVGQSQTIDEEVLRGALETSRTSNRGIMMLADLSDHFVRSELSKSFFEEVSNSIEKLLRQTKISEGRAAAIQRLCAVLCRENVRIGGPARDHILVSAVRHSSVFSRKSVEGEVQFPLLFLRVWGLVASGALSFDDDRRALDRFVQWANGWHPNAKIGLAPVVERLRQRYPDEAFWKRFRFEGIRLRRATHPVAT